MTLADLPSWMATAIEVIVYTLFGPFLFLYAVVAALVFLVPLISALVFCLFVATVVLHAL